MMSRDSGQRESGFLDMQAAVGITKHIGGFRATDELLALCHAARARDLLYVGCGIGVGPAHVARQFGCRVVAVDLSPVMIDWARRRVREAGVEGQVALCPGDVLALPFAAGSFDAVITESVLIFVDDKERAIAECARVARPGGWVGLNEAFWFEPPTPGMTAGVRSAIGPAVPTLVAWQALWEQSGLAERAVQVHAIDAAAEMESRLRWIGGRWLLRAWGRALRLSLTQPAARRAMKAMFDVPADALSNLGHGLFVGRT